MRLEDILKRIFHFLPDFLQTVWVWLLKVEFLSILMPEISNSLRFFILTSSTLRASLSSTFFWNTYHYIFQDLIPSNFHKKKFLLSWCLIKAMILCFPCFLLLQISFHYLHSYLNYFNKRRRSSINQLKINGLFTDLSGTPAIISLSKLNLLLIWIFCYLFFKYLCRMFRVLVENP